MTEEKKEKKEKREEEFVLTDDLRKRALEKPTFNILFIGDGDTRLYPFRGEYMIRTFSTFYDKQANIEYFTASSTKLGNLKAEDLEDVNILWIDNISDYKAAKNLADIQAKLMEKIDPEWKEKFKSLSEKNKEEAEEYANEINKKRSEKLKVIYSIDEFIWDAPVGRSRDIQTVQLMETFLNIADTVVVPNLELRESILFYKFIQDPKKEIVMIPSSVNIDFFPLFRNFNRTGKTEISQLGNKPKVLIKGLSVPKNIEEFIIRNYKKMDITLCSVDEVDDHVKGLIMRQKITHIYHWANPHVNKSNLISTYAIERDSKFDFVIHTKPDNLRGDMYELTTGDEDILFSISYGAIPISGIDHLGYEKESDHLSMATGLTFGKDTPAKKITGIIEKYQSSPQLFNEVFSKARQKVENRISTSPFIISRYFAVMLGSELSKARAEISKEKKAEIEREEEKKQSKIKQEPIEEFTQKEPENIIHADFRKEK